LFFEVEDLAHGAVFEFEQLASHRAFEPINTGNSVADFDNGADLADLHLLLEVADFALQDTGDFRHVDGHDRSFEISNVRFQIELLWRRRQHLFFHRLELIAHRGVDQLIADAHYHAAQDRFVDVLMHDRVAAQRVADALAGLLQLLGRQLLRHAQVDLDLAELLIQQVGVTLRDLPDQAQAVFLVQYAQRVEQQRRDLAAENSLQQSL